MGQKIKQVKGKVLAKHETEAVWDESNYGAGVAYAPELGEKVIYDPDDQHPYPRVKYGDGINIVKYLPFSIDPYAVAFGYEQNLSEKEKARARANLGMEYINEELQNLQEAFTEQVGQLRTDLDSQVEDLQNNKFDKAGGTIDGDLRVAGNLVVSGESTETHLEHVTTPQNTITLRDDQAEGLLEEEYTGLIAKKYDGTNDGMLVFDKEGTAYVGDVGDVQPLATRAPETQMRDGGLVEWNSATKRLQSTDKPVVFSSTETTKELVVYTGDVPVDSANYAQIDRVGGMTRKCANLFDATKATLGYRCNTDGSTAKNGSYATSDYIEVLGGTSYYLTNVCGNYYVSAVLFDESKTVVNCTSLGTGGQVSGVINVGSNIKYIRINIFTDVVDVNTVMVNSGTTALPYEPYFEGLRSAPVTEVKSVGTNLFGGEALADRLVEVANAVKDESTGIVRFSANNVGGKLLYDGFKPNTQYTFILNGWNEYGAGTNLLIGYTDDTVDYLPFPNSQVLGTTAFKSQSGKSIKGLYGVMYASFTNLYYDNCGIFEGVITADAFMSYKEEFLPIPEAVQALDGYGWGADVEYNNHIDFEKKQYIKCVRKLVFDGITDGAKMEDTDPQSNRDSYYAYALKGSIPIVDYTPVVVSDANVIGATHSVLSLGISNSILGLGETPTQTEITNAINKYLNDRYNEGKAVTVMLVMTTPEVIDISEYLAEDNYIGVEAGGTLTFVNEFGYDVPSEIVFYTGNNEVLAADELVGDLLGTANRAIADKNGNDISKTYAKKTEVPETEDYTVYAGTPIDLKAGDDISGKTLTFVCIGPIYGPDSDIFVAGSDPLEMSYDHYIRAQEIYMGGRVRTNNWVEADNSDPGSGTGYEFEKFTYTFPENTKVFSIWDDRLKIFEGYVYAETSNPESSKVQDLDVLGITGSSNGATGLKNLLAAGNTILSSYQYGTTLPAAGNAGRIFFKKAGS